ncbi:MAG: ankyrin repeat domain-containing protein [Candidatus Korobacteraceae bacterium]
MPVKPLPSNPNLDHLKYQAKDLLKAHAARDPEAAQRIREFHPRFPKAMDAEIFAAQLSLSDAQFTIARERGFPSWPRLKAHIEKPTPAGQLSLPHHERIEDAAFRKAVDLLDAGDAAGLRAHLKQYPQLANQHVVFEGGNYFQTPTLLEFVAENPTRRGTLPANIAEVAKVILDAGTTQAAVDETLMLVASSDVAHKCRVQLSLIDLLCDYGADPQSALRTAALFAEIEAVDALIRHGARIDLPVAAALGRFEDARRLLADASSEDRHWALALASQFGHVEIVRMLLDAGEDPNRYNPVGGHSHSTPLHQGAAAGHADVVRLLVERDARLDLKDILWQGTPADWARHAGKTEIEAYLRAQESAKK